jgi:hypothetical protein
MKSKLAVDGERDVYGRGLLSYIAESFRTCYEEAIGTLTFELDLACHSSSLEQHTFGDRIATCARDEKVRKYWKLFYGASSVRIITAALLQPPTLALPLPS